MLFWCAIILTSLLLALCILLFFFSKVAGKIKKELEEAKKMNEETLSDF